MAKSEDVTANPVMLSGEQFQQLLGALQTAKTEGKGSAETDVAYQALLAMSKAQELNAKTLSEQVRRSNTFHPDLSVYTFDPRCEYCTSKTKHPDEMYASVDAIVPAERLAHPKGALNQSTFFCFQRVTADLLTPIELELYNRFDKDVEARNGAWKAMFKRNGSTRELHIFVPFQSVDEKAALPDLTVILTELLYGKAVVDPVLALDAMRKMQEKIAELENRLKPSGELVPA